jgi:hypothetical protein
MPSDTLEDIRLVHSVQDCVRDIYCAPETLVGGGQHNVRPGRGFTATLTTMRGRKSKKAADTPCRGTNMIWELLVLKEGSEVLDASARPPLPFSRPAILKVCQQIDREASPIFWGRNMIAFKELQLSFCISRWGWKPMRMIRHLKLAWVADFDGRLDDLECEADPQDFSGLRTLVIHHSVSLFRNNSLRAASPCDLQSSQRVRVHEETTKGQEITTMADSGHLGLG